MKNTSKYASLLLVGLGITFSGCQDFVKDLDVDPNNPAVVDAANMLQGVQLADALIHEGEAARISSMWTNQFTGVINQYGNINQYDVTTGSFDNVWSTIYVDAITQSRIAIAQAQVERNPRLTGVLQVLEAHVAGTATSLFGDIPYRQANDRVTFPNPVYDPQSQVYADLQTQLNTAIKNLSSTGGAGTDIFFRGNSAQWTEVAHTLKARYFLHTKQYDSARVQALRGISTPSNNWAVPHKEVVGAENYYFKFNNERVGYLSATNAYAAKLLDPARQTGPNAVAGNRNNAKTNEADRFQYFYGTSFTSNINDYQLNANLGFSDPAQSFPILTYAENQLILAEAFAQLNQLSDGLTALNAHRARLTSQYSGGRYDAYTLSDVGNSRAGLIKEILTEKYVTLIGQIEPFNDLRRSNNAVGIPNKLSGSTDVATHPQRFLYPQTEVNTNVNIPNPLPGLFDKTPVNR